MAKTRNQPIVQQGSHLFSDADWLCDLGQVTEPLCVSVSLSLKLSLSSYFSSLSKVGNKAYTEDTSSASGVRGSALVAGVV
jgi:hypothetical protein